MPQQKNRGLLDLQCLPTIPPGLLNHCLFLLSIYSMIQEQKSPIMSCVPIWDSNPTFTFSFQYESSTSSTEMHCWNMVTKTTLSQYDTKVLVDLWWDISSDHDCRSKNQNARLHEESSKKAGRGHNPRNRPPCWEKFKGIEKTKESVVPWEQVVSRSPSTEYYFMLDSLSAANRAVCWSPVHQRMPTQCKRS